MNLKALFARWQASRIQNRARKHRRTLRDRRRRFYEHILAEFDGIYEAEKRSRGLRLFAAWSQRRRPVLAAVEAFDLPQQLRKAA